MKFKHTLIIVFILMLLAQLFVPAKMILDREDVIKTGAVYKFKTSPVDPNDPFRGKYITLSYDANSYDIIDDTDWETNDEVYVEFITDIYGYARIESVSKEEPIHTNFYLKTTVDYVTQNRKISIDYPFNRYYMEESKAYEAERTYVKTQIDTTKTTYALVHIKNGSAVLTDVLINEVPIREIVKRKQALENQ